MTPAAHPAMTGGASSAGDPEFFRFPHTPHLAWLGSGDVRGDKVLTTPEAESFLQADLSVEEKVDGANLGLSLASDGRLRLQQRGEYLQAPFQGQFTRLGSWLAVHGPALTAFLSQPEHRGLVLFGEWCAARHSLDYGALPDLFLLFDVVNPRDPRFWSAARRNALALELGLAAVPTLHRGRLDLPGVVSLLDSAPAATAAVPLRASCCAMTTWTGACRAASWCGRNSPRRLLSTGAPSPWCGTEWIMARRPNLADTGLRSPAHLRRASKPARIGLTKQAISGPQLHA